MHIVRAGRATYRDLAPVNRANSSACNPVCDASRCPLCGSPNACQICTSAAYKGPCWCMVTQIPDALLERVPAESRNQSCICRGCVEAFKASQGNLPLEPGDYYFNGDNQMVFTSAYLLRRGYCCNNGCCHCPYPKGQ